MVLAGFNSEGITSPLLIGRYRDLGTGHLGQRFARTVPSSVASAQGKRSPIGGGRDSRLKPSLPLTISSCVMRDALRQFLADTVASFERSLKITPEPICRWNGC